MAFLRRLFVSVLALWLLVATNPDAHSFSTYLSDSAQNARHHSRFLRSEKCSTHSGARICVRQRRAFSSLNALLKSLFAAHGVHNSAAAVDPDNVMHFEVVDCAIFSVARARASAAPSAFISVSVEPEQLFFGALGRWIPAPTTRALLADGKLLRNLMKALERSDMSRVYAQMRVSSRFRERALPGRPWEWLLALFFIVGAGWLVFPERACQHFTLTWENVRLSGHWWCMVFFHLSHGGSLLRLVRTVVTVSYIAPLLLDRGILSLSDLYGVVLTGSALSTALGMLVLARRYVYGSRSSTPRTALEINGGGGCVYALLVAACLSPNGYENLPGGLMPFELLMINIAFDAVFLAGQKRIADYTAHTGAALGAWLFCGINALR